MLLLLLLRLRRAARPAGAVGGRGSHNWPACKRGVAAADAAVAGQTCATACPRRQAAAPWGLLLHPLLWAAHPAAADRSGCMPGWAQSAASNCASASGTWPQHRHC